MNLGQIGMDCLTLLSYTCFAPRLCSLADVLQYLDMKVTLNEAVISNH